MSTKLAIFLKASREKADLSQAEIAKFMGYQTPQFISNWERGLSTPPIKALKKLSGIMKIDAEKLFNVILEQEIADTTATLKKAFKVR